MEIGSPRPPLPKKERERLRKLIDKAKRRETGIKVRDDDETKKQGRPRNLSGECPKCGAINQRGDNDKLRCLPCERAQAAERRQREREEEREQVLA